MVASFMTEISLLSLIRRMKAVISSSFMGQGLNILTSRFTGRLEKNLLFGEQARETR